MAIHNRSGAFLAKLNESGFSNSRETESVAACMREILPKVKSKARVKTQCETVKHGKIFVLGGRTASQRAGGVTYVGRIVREIGE